MEIPMILWIGWRFLCCFHLGSLTQLEDPKLEVLRRAALRCHQAQPLVLAICWWLGPLTLPLILRKLGQLLKWGLQGCIPRGQRGKCKSSCSSGSGHLPRVISATFFGNAQIKAAGERAPLDGKYFNSESVAIFHQPHTFEKYT